MKFRIKLHCINFCKTFVSVFAIGIIGLQSLSVYARDIDSAAIQNLRSGAEIDYPPFSIVDEYGHADGFSVELMRATLAAMGRDVSFHTGPWTEVRGCLERGEIDALPLVGRTPEREALFDFTVPYMSLYGTIVVRGDETGIQDLDDLRGRRVAVMKGDNAEEFLRRENRGIEIYTTPTFEIALRKLSDGLCDAVVAHRLVALRLIQGTGLTDLRVIDKPIEGFKQDFSFAVREGDRELLALLNEGLAIVTADGTYRQLYSKWFAAMQLPSDRPIVVGGDMNSPPFEFLDEKDLPAGYNVDLTKAIAREMGLNIVIRLGRWQERVQALEAGKIDVLMGMFYSPERGSKYNFSPSHSVGQYIAVVRKGDVPAPVSVDELAKKRIVVQRGDILQDFAQKNGLGKQTITVKDQEVALSELSEGKYDCALVSRIAALYLIDKNKWTNLELGQKSLFIGEYAFATQKDKKALLSQFSEGLNVLEKKGEYHQISEKWLGIYKKESVSFLGFLRLAAFVIVPLILILLIILFWSWSLRRQVREKTLTLQNSLVLLEILHDIDRGILEARPIEKLAQEVCRRIHDIVPVCRRASVTEFQSDRKTARILAVFSGEEMTINAQSVVPLERFGNLNDLRKGQANVVKDVSLERFESFVSQTLESEGIRSYANIPMVADGQLIGTLNIAADETDKIKKTHLDVLEKVAKQMAIALRHDQLRKESLHYKTSFEGQRSQLFEAEVAASLAERNLRTLINTIPDLIWLKDMNGVFIKCNPSFERFFGAKEYEIIGKTDYDFVDKDLADFFRDHDQKALEAGKPSINEEWLTFVEGGYHGLFETIKTPMHDGNNNCIGVLGISRDITAREKAEKEKIDLEKRLFQAQKMESLGSLAGGIAHDFNNILSAILGYTELAIEQAGEGTDLEVHLKEVYQAGLRATDLVRQILTFSRRTEAKLKPLNVSIVIREALKLLRSTLPKSIEFKQHIEKDLDPVLADPTQVHQVIMNLCTNAGHAMEPQGGVLSVSLAPAILGADSMPVNCALDPGSYLKLTVSDTGCGMSADIMGSIFDPYFTTKDLGEGTGLGLSVVHGIVNDCGGDILVESTPGQGSTFTIYLPTIKDAGKEEGQLLVDSLPGGNERILMVDDEPPILKFSRSILEQQGYRVTSENDGLQALDRFRESPEAYDLLVSDVTMPKLTGDRLAERILSIRPDIPVILCTGYSRLISEKTAEGLGVHALIAKPIPRRTLLTEIRKALDADAAAKAARLER